jgi:small-conductance mechanosensitive channel
MASLTLFAIAAIVILDNVGVNVTGLIAGLGIGGIAIGLAAQGIFSDLFAALSIIFDRPFRKGETISFDATTATVERIGLKSTRLRSINGELLVVSNTNLLAKEISNFAHLDRRRVRLMFALVYHTPVDKLRALPDRLAALVAPGGHEFIRGCVTAFGASTIDCELVVDVHSDDLAAVLAARHTLAVDLLENMAAGGYELGYPTQTTYTAAPDGTLVMPYAPPPAPQAKPPRG